MRTEVKRVRRYVCEGEPPAATLAELTERIPENEWKKCSWVTAGGQTRRTRLAWREVFLQHDLRHAGGELEKVWLVVDWPAGDPEPYHYYLAHLHRPPTKARCLKLSRSRWHIEQYFQRSKDDLGLDHFEGRSWRGFHHHLVLSAVAYLFILTVYLRRKKNFWCDVGTDSPHDPALAGEMERTLSLLRNEVRTEFLRTRLNIVILEIRFFSMSFLGPDAFSSYFSPKAKAVQSRLRLRLSPCKSNSQTRVSRPACMRSTPW